MCCDGILGFFYFDMCDVVKLDYYVVFIGDYKLLKVFYGCEGCII